MENQNIEVVAENKLRNEIDAYFITHQKAKIKEMGKWLTKTTPSKKRSSLLLQLNRKYTGRKERET